MTLDDFKRQNRDGLMNFSGDFGLRHKIIHKAAPRYWRWSRGVFANAFRLQRSYSTPGPVSTAMGDCLRAGTAIGFRASREHYLKVLVYVGGSRGSEAAVVPEGSCGAVT